MNGAHVMINFAELFHAYAELFDAAGDGETGVETETETETETCMISKAPLDPACTIQLTCGHKFNYIPLYRDLCASTKRAKFGTTGCPYCRLSMPFLLPNYHHPSVFPRKGINHPSKLCMPQYCCSWVPTTGKGKFIKCTRGGTIHPEGVFCSQHHASHLKLVKEQAKKAEKAALAAAKTAQAAERTLERARTLHAPVQRSYEASKKAVHKAAAAYHSAAAAYDAATEAHADAYACLEQNPCAKTAKKEEHAEKQMERANAKHVKAEVALSKTQSKHAAVEQRWHVASARVDAATHALDAAASAAAASRFSKQFTQSPAITT